MHDDKHAVRGRMHVEFEHVDTHLRRIFEGFERVFGIKPAAAAMSEDKRTRRFVFLKNSTRLSRFSDLHREVNINPGENYDHAENKIAEKFKNSSEHWI